MNRELDKLLLLVRQASEGIDNLKEGAVGYYKFGFIFRKTNPCRSADIGIRYRSSTKNSSSKFASVGAFRDVIKNFKLRKYMDIKGIKDLSDLLRYDPKLDCLLAGSLKTLIPDLTFGGDEHLFGVWMLVKTPSDEIFPAIFYYGPSGTSLGGWESYDDRNVFPSEFRKIINISPFDFSKDKLQSLIEALELALNKVPVSDFYAIYEHDLGRALMGVREGTPFSIEIDQLIKQFTID